MERLLRGYVFHILLWLCCARQETHQLDAKHDSLVGIHVPNIYVLPKLNSDHAPTQEGLYAPRPALPTLCSYKLRPSVFRRRLV